MTKSKLLAGLEDALAYERGDTSRGTLHKVEVFDVAAIRKRLGMSQNAFAKTLNISSGTVKNWEQGLRAPTGPARTLLHVIAKEPEAVMRAMAAE